MDYEKILESLKICSEVGTSCEGCSGRGERHCIANLTKAAAIAIETLLHALDMARRERDVVTKRMIELEQEVCRLKSRLAAYEDTGLDPEEIKAHEAAKYNAGYYHGDEDRCRWIEKELGPIDHLRDLLQAEQDGRLVVLPCKVGDHVWADGREAIVVWFFGYKTERYLHAQFFDNAEYTDIPFYEIGKTVFLTREEAEAALKGGDGL